MSTEINNNEETSWVPDEDLVEKREIRKKLETLPNKGEKKHQTKRRKRKLQRRNNKSKINAKVVPVIINLFSKCIVCVYSICAIGLQTGLR